MYTLQPILTADGSYTFFIPELNEHYHSTFGAVQESNHVFINNGLLFFRYRNPEIKEINIFEMGFGTGLNALLTWHATRNLNLKINYTTVETYPISIDNIRQLNLKNVFDDSKLLSIFEAMHTADWDKKTTYNKFTLEKKHVDIIDYQPCGDFDLVYFDAFAPEIQPDLWNYKIFEKIHESMCHNAVLTTYSAKGIIRRLLSEIGFNVEKIAGPPGKRHVLRAIVQRE